jgi:hypothetical protein
MRILPLYICLLLVHTSSESQDFDHTWIFGDSVGISFNTSPPSVLHQSVLSSTESSASISNSTGQLQFYVGAPTNFATWNFWKHQIWNYQHQVMQNGDSIAGNSSFNQGALIIPKPLDSGRYYVFTIGRVQGVGDYLYHSIVDMMANSGFGSVILKNVIVDTDSNSVSEKMTAIKHGNGRDWWIITHEYGSKRFILHSITPQGITGPYYTTIGTDLYHVRQYGQMISSRDGSKLAIVGFNRMLDLFDFDRCSGTIGNWTYLGDTINLWNNSPPPIPYRGYYGASFSPNNQLFYVNTPDSVFQFDLNSSNIKQSKTIIYSSSCGDTCWLGQQMITPTDQIYIAHASSGPGFGTHIYNSHNTNLSVIENPNSPGINCNFSYGAFSLDGERGFLGLPNLPNYSLTRKIGSTCDTLVVGESTVSESNIELVLSGDGFILKSDQTIRFELLLSDVVGRIVYSNSVIANTKYSIRLKTGIYLYRVFSKSKIVDQGKIYYNAQNTSRP